MKRLLHGRPLLILMFIIALGSALILSKERDTGYVAIFHNNGNQLSGVLLLPINHKSKKSIILFVHGDGPTNFDADGYYSVIWQKLCEQGFAIFSWDKPGVGNSTGNWLNQTMVDRQAETLTAIKFVKQEYGYKTGEIGLMWFSQAGWVVPAVASKSEDVGFVIGIGFAIDWLEQGWFLNKTRLVNENSSETEIKEAYTAHLEDIKFLRQKPTYIECRYVGGYGTLLVYLIL